MEDRIFLLVKYTIKTKHKTIHEAIQELQSKTEIKISIEQHFDYYGDKAFKNVFFHIMPVTVKVKFVEAEASI
jgi:hypothetical protein